MKKSHRYFTAVFMTTVYLLLIFSPLASLAWQSKFLAHAATGECSGDCRVDGCSQERSAAHTCCCWQKKLRKEAETKKLVGAGCCATKQSLPELPAPKNAGCCGLKPAAETPKQSAGCCTPPVQTVHEDSGHSADTPDNTTHKKGETSVSSSPCGSGKLFTLFSSEKTQHLPYFYAREIPSPWQNALTFLPPDRLTSRFGDPPDPPPIIC